MNGDRNYSLFGILAGVRDETAPQFSELRGIPEDISNELIRILKRDEVLDEEGEIDVGYHNHSYINVDDIKEIRRLYVEHTTKQLPLFISNLEKLRIYPFVQDVRMVFYFDS